MIKKPTKEEEKLGLYIITLIFGVAFISAVIGATNSSKGKKAEAPVQPAVAEAFPERADKLMGVPEEKTAAASAAASEKRSGKDSAYERTFLSETIGTCVMKDWGIEFRCDEKWEVEFKEASGDPEVVIFDDPRIILSWRKFDENIRFLGQLNRIFFEDTGKYKDGFRTEDVEFGGHQAIMVKGFASNDPDTQRRDYFYLHDDRLVNISFSISPKDKWEDGKLVLQEVTGTFSLLGN